MSRVGLKPISLPEKVAVNLSGRTVIVEGPKGKLDFNLPEGISLTSAEGNVIVSRATVKGQDLDLSLGRSHPLLHPIPSGLTVTVAENTKIKVEGIDKQLVGQFAADVRNYYPPEPYKGKGVRYTGEKVRRKEGKSVGK